MMLMIVLDDGLGDFGAKFHMMTATFCRKNLAILSLYQARTVLAPQLSSGSVCAFAMLLRGGLQG